MADLPARDAALLLDMLIAARDARSFVEGLDEAPFGASYLHQNAGAYGRLHHLFVGYEFVLCFRKSGSRFASFFFHILHDDFTRYVSAPNCTGA
jgi:hypothetical protein